MYENEQEYSVTYARLSDIAKKNLSQIGSMTIHTTPQEYCINKEYMTEETVKRVNAEVRRQPKSFGKILDFPLKAYEMSLLTEEQVIDVLTQFKTLEIMPAAAVKNEVVIFNTFKYDYCKKKQFFQYATNDPDENYFYVSITHFAVFADCVKRYIPSFKVRITLPNVIDEMLDEAKARLPD